MKGMIILTIVVYSLLGAGTAAYIIYMNRLRTLAKAEKARKKALEEARRAMTT